MTENTVRKLKVVEKGQPESDGYKYADQCRELIESGQVSQAEFARELGCSPAKLGEYYKRRYNVSMETLVKFDQQVGEALARRARRNRKSIAREDVLIKTSHAKKLEGYLAFCHDNAKIRIVRGGTGIGKSHVFRHYQKRHQNVYVQVCRDSRRAGRLFVGDLYRAVIGEKLPQDKKYYEAEDAIFEKLEKQSALLIFDDAHKLSTRTLNLIIELYDACQHLGIVLGDQSDAQDSPGYNRAIDFDRNPQILRRIGGSAWNLEFEISRADVEAFCHYFGVTSEGVVTWLSGVVNMPKTRYDWLSEIVAETVSICGDHPDLLQLPETFERIHRKLRRGE